MGKIKANQAISMKISKSKPKLEDNSKKQLNKLIKVLRPKVYITDSSSFKRLVQELTGNGNNYNNIAISPHAPPTTNITTSPHDQLLLEDHEIAHDHDHGHEELFQLESSQEMSSVDSESLELFTTNNMCFGSCNSPANQLCSYLFNDQYQMADVSQLRGLESWVLDMDHQCHHQHQFPYYYDSSKADQQAVGVEVGVYDYDHLFDESWLI